MKVALIVSTYNRPTALALCLKSIAGQNVFPDEVIIADDGSGKETAECINAFAKDFPVPLHYVWHEDKGFRLAKIRNRAIAATSCDYIIQIDGDVILHPSFIKDHIKAARARHYVKGSRIRLNEKFTGEIEKFSLVPPIRPWTRGIMKDREKAVHLGLLGRLFTRVYKKNQGTAIGCNMAFWRDDFIRINGYDENFIGWGCEDDDLCRRFDAMGISNFKLFRIGLVYHLWHPEQDKSKYTDSIQYLYSKTDSEFYSKKGIDQYLKNDGDRS